MNQRNYQLELEKIIQKAQQAGERPRLLIHACCAPCSSYVMEYLDRYFDMDFYYYNPNIDTKEEHALRIAELKRLCGELPLSKRPGVIESVYDPVPFYAAAKGHERDHERGERCLRCFRLRLFEAARFTKEENERCRESGRPGYDYFTTTLTISPMKDAAALNAIGEAAAEAFGLCWLPSDFKKKNGYKRSTELSRLYGLYRQDYCGCVYSKREREAFRKAAVTKDRSIEAESAEAAKKTESEAESAEAEGKTAEAEAARLRD